MKISELEQQFENRIPGTMGAPTRFAVLVPLVEKDGEAHLLFEVRSQHVAQPGEICFPGGHMEGSESAEECALRETEEELGIPRSAIHPIARLDKMSGSRGVIYPLLARVDSEAVAAMKADPWEVADTFLVPVDFFIEQKPRLYRFPFRPEMGEHKQEFNELIGHPDGYPWKMGKDVQPLWIYENHVIWGLTAKILLWNFRNNDWK